MSLLHSGMIPDWLQNVLGKKEFGQTYVGAVFSFAPKSLVLEVYDFMDVFIIA